MGSEILSCLDFFWINRYIIAVFTLVFFLAGIIIAMVISVEDITNYFENYHTHIEIEDDYFNINKGEADGRSKKRDAGVSKS